MTKKRPPIMTVANLVSRRVAKRLYREFHLSRTHCHPFRRYARSLAFTLLEAKDPTHNFQKVAPLAGDRRPDNLEAQPAKNPSLYNTCMIQ